MLKLANINQIFEKYLAEENIFQKKYLLTLKWYLPRWSAGAVCVPAPLRSSLYTGNPWQSQWQSVVAMCGWWQWCLAVTTQPLLHQPQYITEGPWSRLLEAGGGGRTYSLSSRPTTSFPLVANIIYMMN